MEFQELLTFLAILFMEFLKNSLEEKLMSVCPCIPMLLENLLVNFIPGSIINYSIFKQQPLGYLASSDPVKILKLDMPQLSQNLSLMFSEIDHARYLETEARNVVLVMWMMLLMEYLLL